jgi:hypothetical protein
MGRLTVSYADKSQMGQQTKPGTSATKDGDIRTVYSKHLVGATSDRDKGMLRALAESGGAGGAHCTNDDSQ